MDTLLCLPPPATTSPYNHLPPPPPPSLWLDLFPARCRFWRLSRTLSSCVYCCSIAAVIAIVRRFAYNDGNFEQNFVEVKEKEKIFYRLVPKFVKTFQWEQKKNCPQLVTDVCQRMINNERIFAKSAKNSDRHIYRNKEYLSNVYCF